MIRTLLPIMALLLTLGVEAQFTIGLSGGGSFPAGIYGDKYGRDAGYATAGGTFNLEAGYQINDLLGASLLWGGAVHGVNEVALGNEAGIPSSQFDAGDWVQGYFLIGPSVGISKETYDIKAHLRLGSITGSGPYISGDGVYLDGGDSEAGFA